MLKLKLQYFGHLMRRTDSLEKTLMLRKVEDKRRKVQQRMRRLDGITNSMDMSLGKLQGRHLGVKRNVTGISQVFPPSWHLLDLVPLNAGRHGAGKEWK